jgi:hypothetical protein
MIANPSPAGLAALSTCARPYKVSIGAGLYLEVMPSGSKRWRLKYRFAGRENKLSFGAFPAVSLKQPCQARKAQIKAGIDPGAVRKAERAEPQAQKTKANDFRLALSTQGALSIEAQRQSLRRTPEQTVALRAFLAATLEKPCDGSDG